MKQATLILPQLTIMIVGILLALTACILTILDISQGKPLDPTAQYLLVFMLGALANAAGVHVASNLNAPIPTPPSSGGSSGI